jgi:trimeric autotransporter adhesin
MIFTNKKTTTLLLAFASFVTITITGCDKKELTEKKYDSYLEYPNLPRNGLIAYYPLNGNANDYSGNSRHASLYGTETTTDRFGTSNKALTFDGIDDYIEISNFPSLNNNSGTICLWVRTRSDFGDETRVVLSKIDIENAGYIIKAFDQGSFWFQSRISNGSNMGSNWLINPYASNTYFFIAITFTSSTYRTYHQGYETYFTSSNLDWLFNDNELPLLVGKSSLSGPLNFKGDIDDILIYNRELSSEEIWGIYSWKYSE